VLSELCKGAVWLRIWRGYGHHLGTSRQRIPKRIQASRPIGPLWVSLILLLIVVTS
jgi:hypothetical protein